MSKESKVFRKGLAQYISDLNKVNTKLAHEHATRKDPFNTLPPRYVQASMGDMLYWANQTGHYAFLADQPNTEEAEGEK